MKTVILKKGREDVLLRRHPWVFSNAIQKTEGAPGPGDLVEVIAHDGNWLARGGYSPISQIRVRIWTFLQEQQIDREFFQDRLSRAIAARQTLTETGPKSAVRLLNAESDGIPGVIVDKYADYLVCQFSSASAEPWKQMIVDALAELSPWAGIYERSDLAVREKEGLVPMSGLLRGQSPPDRVEIEENGLCFLVDIKAGHKTGFYLDQRDNRRLLAEHSSGRKVLNCFCYTGGFGVHALKAGAEHVVNIDTSASALQLAAENADLNRLEPDRFETLEADVFARLRVFRNEGRMFDVVVMDPPRFAESKQQLQKASRGYKDINMLAFRLLRRGGLLFTFSCSGHMGEPLFQKIIADAALDAGCEAQIIRRLGQAADHPVALNFPEGAYLKGLVCRVL